MAYSSYAVANAFLDLAKKNGMPLSNMQVQKLVFLAQGYSLALLDDSLFYHDIKAWEYGPVVPQLYKKLKKYGAGYVTEPIQSEDAIPEGSKEASIIEAVWKAFGKYSGPLLSKITHKEGSPWHQVWSAGKKFEKISPELIAQYYKNAVGEGNVQPT